MARALRAGPAARGPRVARSAFPWPTAPATDAARAAARRSTARSSSKPSALPPAPVCHGGVDLRGVRFAAMATTHYRSCTLCEAGCGVAVTVDGDRVVDVRGDEADTFSKGYICPKASALADLHHDPDRLRHPVVRDGERWREVGWDEAFELVATNLNAIRARHGKHAIGVYQGNPTAHNLGLL